MFELAIDGLDGLQKNQVLKVCSLVCSAWSFEACALLWFELEIKKERVAKRILKSEALGRYHTQAVSIFGRSNQYQISVTAAKAMNLLLAMCGVHKLTLDNFDGDEAIGLDIFCVRTLSNTS